MIDPQIQIKTTSAVCSFVAIATTVHRLIIRIPGPGLWWDDVWALFSTLSLIMQVVAVFMEVPSPPGIVGVSRYYMMAVGFYSIIWSARLSILFSLRRVDRGSPWSACYGAIVLLFFLTWMSLLVQLFCVCEPQVNWKQLPLPQCHLPKSVPILQVATDVFADCLLLWMPMRLLRAILNPNLRKRLMLIFSTCVTTTIVSLVHATFIMVTGGPPEIISAVVEDCVSLMVCNLPLCVAHILRRGKWFEDEDPIPISLWISWLRTSRQGIETPHAEHEVVVTDVPIVVSVDLATARPSGSYPESHGTKNLGSQPDLELDDITNVEATSSGMVSPKSRSYENV